MAMEQALISRARPHMITARVEALTQNEVGKGCMPEILTFPVALEPAYCPISLLPERPERDDPYFTFEPLPAIDHLVRLQVWPSPEEKFSWLNCELFLKQICSTSRRVGFEIAGNRRDIKVRLVVHHDDLPIVRTAFMAQFERCELTPTEHGLLPQGTGPHEILFVDCLPPPPYSHLFTRPDELQVTTFRSLVASLMDIEPPATGFYQVLAQSASPANDWHRNVEVLLDIEYTMKQLTDVQRPQSFYLQQAPSGDLRQMAREVETKAHNDKPFYWAAVRLGVAHAGERAPFHLQALATFLSLFQHGGRPLRCVSHNEYRAVLSLEAIEQMFVLAGTYRPGFLVNSSELAGFFHVPPADILKFREPRIGVLDTLPIRDPSLLSGTPIGKNVYAGVEQPVCIPPRIRTRHTHIIGKPGQGKSTIMARMVLDDIDKGMGVVVIDPHGDLVDYLLCLIKKEHVERTLYFDPGDPDHVALWNPLKPSRGQELSRTADEFVGAIKNVVTGWGDRLEHLLRHAAFALLQIPESTLLDLANLLRRDSEEGNTLRQTVLDVVDNEMARGFWERDFRDYSKEALDPPKHKLSKLLVAGSVSRILSQPDSLIDFRRIMDEGMIFLVNLSTIGSEVREILGCFILSLFRQTALARSGVPQSQRRDFHIYVDEAHRFVTDSLEDLIAETRKYRVGLTLAHQYFSQFGTKKVDALSSVGTTIIMNVDGKDARYLTKDLRNQVKAEDLMGLDLGQAIVRIGTQIVKVKLEDAPEIPQNHHRDEIIERSRKLYYRPAAVVRAARARKDNRHTRPAAPLVTTPDGELEEFFYDEF